MGSRRGEPRVKPGYRRMVVRSGHGYGMPAARFVTGGELDWLVAFEIHDGRITGLCAIRNPDKLHRAETVLPLEREGHQPWSTPPSTSSSAVGRRPGMNSAV